MRYANFQPTKFLGSFQKLLATFFQFLDIWWSTLDIMDEFKPLISTAIFRFGEIKQSLFFFAFKKKSTF